VEDEAIIAMDIKASLEEAGATVAGSAQTLPQALEFAKHLDMAAAILDVRLGSRLISPVAEILRGRGAVSILLRADNRRRGSSRVARCAATVQTCTAAGTG
jgi:CheY-like chemotaxis protein